MPSSLYWKIKKVNFIFVWIRSSIEPKWAAIKAAIQLICLSDFILCFNSLFKTFLVVNSNTLTHFIDIAFGYSDVRSRREVKLKWIVLRWRVNVVDDQIVCTHVESTKVMISIIDAFLHIFGKWLNWMRMQLKYKWKTDLLVSEVFFPLEREKQMTLTRRRTLPHISERACIHT